MAVQAADVAAAGSDPTAGFVPATQLMATLEAMAARFAEGRPVRFTGHGSKDFYGGPLGDAEPMSTLS
ncbi:hypothetical protein, partial [Roseateles sp.]|uniref:hypothetical protein n=1 Tax=Roseateles sp. TaxID=1971397 RepID=UPI002F3FC7F2